MRHVEHLAHLSPLRGGLREDGVRLLGHLPPARSERNVLLPQAGVPPLLLRVRVGWLGLGLGLGLITPLLLRLEPGGLALLRLSARWASHLRQPGGRWRARALPRLPPRLPSLLTLFV